MSVQSRTLLKSRSPFSLVCKDKPLILEQLLTSAQADSGLGWGRACAVPPGLAQGQQGQLPQREEPDQEGRHWDKAPLGTVLRPEVCGGLALSKGGSNLGS